MRRNLRWVGWVAVLLLISQFSYGWARQKRSVPVVIVYELEMLGKEYNMYVADVNADIRAGKLKDPEAKRIIAVGRIFDEEWRLAKREVELCQAESWGSYCESAFGRLSTLRTRLDSMKLKYEEAKKGYSK